MQPIKAPEQIKGSITPRVRIQVDTKALKGSDNKENRVRNSSVGSVKRSNEAKPISIFTKNIELKKADEEASNAMIIKYQDLINKKDQIIDSMGKTIESLNNQLTQAQDNVKSTQLQISNMRGAYNEDLTKMKFKVKKLEEKRGHSLTQRNANISADNKDNYKEKIESYINDKNSSEFTKLKEQLIAQTKNYKIKYDSLAKEKERQFDNIRVAKRLLEYEESNHKKTKDKLKNAQKELNALKQALGKRK
jgi:chromosome segregation ATPase